MKRRIFSLGLALCFLVGLCIPALATTTATASGQEVTATLTATVKSTTVNVTVPTALPFTLDITKNITESVYGQITAGETFTVTNNTDSVPVYLAVKDVVPDSDSGIQMAHFIASLNAIQDSVFLDIFRSGDGPDYSSTGSAQGAFGRRTVYENSWYKIYDRYYLTPSGSPIGVNSSRSFYLSAATGDAFTLYGGQSFYFTVTFVVYTQYAEPVYVRAVQNLYNL